MSFVVSSIDYYENFRASTQTMTAALRNQRRSATFLAPIGYDVSTTDWKVI